jgi:hypothetical protein
MAETAKRSARTKVEAVPDPAPEPEPSTTADDARHEPTTCPVAWCPVCLAVTAVQPVRPEVVEHLLKAGTEFFLALRSLIDARADDLTPPDDDADASLHKIDIG